MKKNKKVKGNRSVTFLESRLLIREFIEYIDNKYLVLDCITL